ncbi:cytochrome P450 9e2-like [Chrysoperla carnea]|uniref:cytochrome P450 9e2-like n=1 Tax=Chrysoperla carnea TaxID=189513 RepID=UPI001D073990|nr:cytochrome P450 9e2-like [Chrysoperla carnea]
MLIVVLVIFVIIVAAYWLLITPLSHWEKRGIPYVKGLPIVGNFFWHTMKQTTFGDELVKIYNTYPEKKLYGMFMFNTPTILVRDLDMLKNILIKQFEYFVDHSNSLFQEDINPMLDKNLFSLKGNKWRDMRATLSPTFTGSKMRGMFQLINEVGEQFVDYFKNEIQTKNNGKPMNVELKDILTRFTNDVIASAAFGVKCDSLRDRNNEFYRMGAKVSNLSTWRMFINNFCPKLAKFFRIGLIPNEVCDYLRNIVIETIKMRERENIVRPDMLQLLLDAKNGTIKQDKQKIETDNSFAAVEESNYTQIKKRIYLDEDDVAAQAFVFFMGGFDTVSIAMCFSVYELALHPELQERLYLENEQVLSENNGKLTYDVLNKMKYLDMVISETLRKYPPPIFLDRICDKPYTVQVDGKEITLEKGTILTIPLYAMHTDPNYFPEPEKFDPDRFSDENADKIVPLTYIPFGSGPRNCIASRFALMEAKTAVYFMVKHFEILPNEKSIIPPRITTKRINVTMEDGFHVTLKPRNQGFI